MVCSTGPIALSQYQYEPKNVVWKQSYEVLNKGLHSGNEAANI
jgi:hypothetical protein